MITALLWPFTMALAAGTVAIFGFARFGSASAGFKYIAGDRVLITPSSYDFYVGGEPNPTAKNHEVFPFRVHNCTERPVKVLGTSTATCTCAVASGVPTTIEPRESGTISLTLRPRAIGTNRAARVHLLTDSPAAPTITASIVFHHQD